MGNHKQIANSEEKKSRKSHRLLGCQRGLSNEASGGDRRYPHAGVRPPTSADTCPKHKKRREEPCALRAAPPLSANLEQKLNRSSLESHRWRLPFNRPELANNQKRKEIKSPFLFKKKKKKKKKHPFFLKKKKKKKKKK